MDAGRRTGASTSGPAAIRLDKWLWHARFFRSRSLACAAVVAGGVRVNGVRAVKPSHPVHCGDTLTFVQAGRVRVVHVIATSLRRGPAAEAQGLYRDLDPAPAGRPPAALE